MCTDAEYIDVSDSSLTLYKNKSNNNLTLNTRYLSRNTPLSTTDREKNKEKECSELCRTYDLFSGNLTCPDILAECSKNAT